MANKKIKFLKNYVINGEAVGPDYETDVAELPELQAQVYINEGDAVEVPTKSGKGDK